MCMKYKLCKSYHTFLGCSDRMNRYKMWLKAKAGKKGRRCGLISVYAKNWLHLVCSIKKRDSRSTNYFYLMKLIWKCLSQQCAPPWLVVFEVRPIVFDKIGCKNLGEVKWPAGQDKSDWSILNWLNRCYSCVYEGHWHLHWNVMSVTITHEINGNAVCGWWIQATSLIKDYSY